MIYYDIFVNLVNCIVDVLLLIKAPLWFQHNIMLKQYHFLDKKNSGKETNCWALFLTKNSEMSGSFQLALTLDFLICIYSRDLLKDLQKYCQGQPLCYLEKSL